MYFYLVFVFVFSIVLYTVLSKIPYFQKMMDKDLRALVTIFSFIASIFIPFLFAHLNSIVAFFLTLIGMAGLGFLTEWLHGLFSQRGGIRAYLQGKGLVRKLPGDTDENPEYLVEVELEKQIGDDVSPDAAKIVGIYPDENLSDFQEEEESDENQQGSDSEMFAPSEGGQELFEGNGSNKSEMENGDEPVDATFLTDFVKPDVSEGQRLDLSAVAGEDDAVEELEVYKEESIGEDIPLNFQVAPESSLDLDSISSEKEASLEPAKEHTMDVDIETTNGSEIKIELEDEVEPLFDAQSENQVEPGIKIELEPKAELVEQSKIELTLESDIESTMKLEMQPKIEPVFKTEGESEVQPNVEQEAKPEVKPEVENAAESEVKLEFEEEVEPEVKLEIEEEIEPEVQPEVEEEVELEVQPKVEEEVGPEVQSKVEEEVEPEVQSKVEEEAEPEVQLKVEEEVEPEVQPEMEEEAEPEVQPKVEEEVGPEVQPKMEGEVETGVQPETIQTVEPEIKSGLDPNLVPGIESAVEELEAEPELRPDSSRELFSRDKDGMMQAFGGLTEQPIGHEISKVGSEQLQKNISEMSDSLMIQNIRMLREKNNLDDAASLCMEVMEKETDIDVTFEAVYEMCSIYKELGQKELGAYILRGYIDEYRDIISNDLKNKIIENFGSEVIE